MYYNWNCITNSTLISGIYGVGKAAVNPPALVVLSHTPPKASTTIAWVGKGIVYDTGGLSLKTKVQEHVSYLEYIVSFRGGGVAFALPCYSFDPHLEFVCQ